MVNYHFLNQKQPLKGIDAINTIFDRLQVIQFDTLNVVGRNSDLVLQSRIKGYKSTYLEDKLYKERYIVDHWDKQMAIIQTKYFSHFKRIREHRAEGEINVLRHRLQLEALDYVDEVLNIIEEEGPIYSSQIKIGESKKHRWGQTKPSSATLDYLFHLGKIGIHSKKNVMKRYDLIDRLIEQDNIDPFNTEEEFIEWYLLRRIKSVGVFWNKPTNFCGLHISNKTIRSKYINRLVEQKELIPCTVDGIKETVYIYKDVLSIENNVKKKVSIIAPLDNLIWDRDFILELFDFDYKWEVYVPIVKRRWGYYVLPILYGSEFVGRIEFEKQRKQDPLVITNVFYEDNFKRTKLFFTELDKALKEFQKYLGASSIENTNKLKG